jgi:hypothetical protein
MRLYIPWIGSLVIEAVLVILIFRRGVHKRFSFFCAFVIYDLLRAIGIPIAVSLSQRPNLYFYLYWLSFPVEYTLTFLILIQIFAYVFRVQILESPRPIQIFILSVLALFVISAILVLFPDIPTSTTTGLILTLDRSIELLICGLLLFMWAYSTQLRLSMQDHVWGIILGLGIYSGVSLMVAAIAAATGRMCPGWIPPLPHFAYLASTAIWTFYLFRKEPEPLPLSDERLTGYQNLISKYKTLVDALRKAAK